MSKITKVYTARTKITYVYMYVSIVVLDKSGCISKVKLISDTVGSLASGVYLFPGDDCMIGLSYCHQDVVKVM